MNKQIEQQVARAKRVGFFIAEHTITPAIPRVTVLAGQVTTWIGEAETEGSDQVQGFGDFRGGSGTRAEMARALQKRLRQIGRTARSLPRDLFPGVREQFRVPNSLRYHYRDSDPALYAVWKTAVRVHVPAAIPSSSSSSPPSGGGSGSTAAPALASAASLLSNGHANGETDTAAIDPRVNGKGGVLVG